ncbi:hypothetical protein ASC66_04240 [Leifsonia sp. Root4]|uniref:NAD-dependent epimerase/dehydratase family protein n=1 Tax=Leifsonia sp. Root4 TaxID=1736525 RepID=UPI0006F7B4C1|nr:NAD-dependent epimerase/dehydratase family protein [Leifsonia sp. Root4]KQW08151.1 hypothetical protein ASC66_04240 [Leifsonia sp. Root4]
MLGASGFIGRSTLEAAQNRTNATAIGVHRNSDFRAGFIRGDITDITSLHAAFNGVGGVVHSASYIGYDEAECERVNVRGTANVIEACTKADVARLIYVSTAGVYGAGVHRNAREPELVVAPNSVLSASRARAEELVLEAGGIVVRPHFVFGAGDKWLVPGILKLITGINGLPDGGRARHSAIDVEVLGELLAGLVVAADIPGPTVFHAAEEEPVTLTHIVQSALSPAEFDALESLTRAEAYERAQNAGLSARHIDWLADDHVYDSSAIREAIFKTSTRGLL